MWHIKVKVTQICIVLHCTNITNTVIGNVERWRSLLSPNKKVDPHVADFHRTNYSFTPIRESPLTVASNSWEWSESVGSPTRPSLRKVLLGKKECRRNRRRAMRITHTLYASRANTYSANGTFSTVINAILSGPRLHMGSTFRSTTAAPRTAPRDSSPSTVSSSRSDQWRERTIPRIAHRSLNF